MLEIAVVSAAGALIVLAVAVFLATKRVKRHRNQDPTDIYPLW